MQTSPHADGGEAGEHSSVIDQRAFGHREIPEGELDRERQHQADDEAAARHARQMRDALEEALFCHATQHAEVKGHGAYPSAREHEGDVFRRRPPH